MSTGARSTDQDLGDILLAAHILDEPKLAQARRECQRTSRPLWRILTRDSLVTEDALFRALRQEVRVPVLAADQIKSVVMPEELRTALPADVAQHLGILPLERSTDGRRAVLAMVDPTADITPIWPALGKLGVIEVRRFLVHLGTLRLGLEFFYNVPWQTDAAEDSAPDSLAKPALPRSAITQPIPGKNQTERTSSVVVDAGLRAEITDMDAPTDPPYRPGSGPACVSVSIGKGEGAVHTEPPLPSAVSRSSSTPRRPGTSSSSLRPPVPSPVGISASGPIAVAPSSPASGASLPPRGEASGASLRPVQIEPPPNPSPAQKPMRKSREISLPELEAADVLMVEDQPLQLDRAAMLPEGEPVQEALLAAAEALLTSLEAEMATSRPRSLARLAQAVAERLGFASRAVHELTLVTRLYGLLLAQLERRGPLPPTRKDMLGYETDLPLQAALRELQGVLVDFIRLPTEPDIVPMGARIVEAVVTTLDLYDKERAAAPQADMAQLSEALRLRLRESEVSSALVQILENDLSALGIEPEPPAQRTPQQAEGPSDATPSDSASQHFGGKPESEDEPAEGAEPKKSDAPAPRGVVFALPRPPIMPDVRWRTGAAVSLSAEGLLPYEPAAEPGLFAETAAAAPENALSLALVGD